MILFVLLKYNTFNLIEEYIEFNRSTTSMKRHELLNFKLVFFKSLRLKKL